MDLAQGLVYGDRWKRWKVVRERDGDGVNGEQRGKKWGNVMANEGGGEKSYMFE